VNTESFIAQTPHDPHPGLRRAQETTPFDLSERAPNGLRRGFTTGTSAAAAAKAALLLLLTGSLPATVDVTLPDGLHYLTIPITPAPMTPADSANGWSCASVIKDGGDDPDQTHGARIIVRLRRNDSGQLLLLRGKGVGVVTQPGLRLAIGEPAINAVPRRMIRQAIEEVFECDAAPSGFDVEVGCENGEAIARRTFNPRLGIEGGISILGTTGIVEPKSLASFKASIEVYVRVALGERPAEIVLSPGNLGQRFARNQLALPLNQIVQMSNFAGFALDCLTAELSQLQHVLPRLWIVGHPGKLAKLINGTWDTHSHRSAGAVEALLPVAEAGWPSLSPLLRDAPSTEAFIECTSGRDDVGPFWDATENAIAECVRARVSGVDEVRVRLFAMDGSALGTAA
jgi:cobalt-precorrin-5B (C1)-methyltransferase